MADVPPTWEGYIGAVVAIVLYGVYCLPAKKYDTGDGMFFQWVVCCGIWCGGLVCNIIQGFPPFQPFAMLGGAIWSFANLTLVPIVNTVGMGLGFLVWCAVALVVGWACPRFGLFSITPEIPTNVAMNYVGVSLAVVSVIFFALVKTEVHVDQSLMPDQSTYIIQSDINETTSLLAGNSGRSSTEVVPAGTTNSATLKDNGLLGRLSSFYKRIIGIVLSVGAGVLYGLQFVPTTIVKDNADGASQNDMDYIFPMFSGILSSSTVYMVLYCAYMRNNPKVYPEIIFPGILIGILWSIATIGWALASRILSVAIAFPVVACGPGLISAMIGVVFFKEIKGLRNLMLLFTAVAFAVTGAVLVGLSK